MGVSLILAIASQFMFAISVLVDRHIVLRAEHIGRPIVYTFYVSLMSGAVALIGPFASLSTPSVLVLGMSALNAALFTISIFFLYSSLKMARASDVAPVVGALSALVTLALSLFLLEGDIAQGYIIPALLLASGTGLISHFHFSRRAMRSVTLSGIFFGLTVYTSKLIFLETSFVDGFFWMRIMNVAVACSLLCVPVWRRAILHGTRHSSAGAKFLVLANKIVGGTASILFALAVSMGSVALVNAMNGLQFVFLFLLALVFGRFMPRLRDSHDREPHGGLHTAGGIALIVLGLGLLSVVISS